MTEKVKILLLLANPFNTGTLRLGEETREIIEKINDGPHRDVFEVIHHLALRPRDLEHILLTHQAHIVHFSGHGSLDKEILLEGDTGNAQQMSKKPLADLFRILKDNLRIVVFNACYTNELALAVSNVVDFTIGTNNTIGDKAAIAFAGAFYGALAFGRSVKEAFELGQTELGLRSLKGAEMSEFFVKEGVDPDKPFLPLKKADRASDEELKAALKHLLAETASEDERLLVRRELIEGSIILEPVEGMEESEDQILDALDKIDAGRTAHVEISSKAYRRIQEQLYPPPPGLGPPLPGFLFIGREDSLTDVKRLLGVSGNIKPSEQLTVVRGWPGVGKTTLVGVIGRDSEVLKKFPDGVLWTSLDQTPELISKLAEWGRVLGTDELLRIPTLDEAVLKLQALIQNRRMLLIVDDVWNQAHTVPFIKAATGSQCALLTTTRLTSVAEALTDDEERIYVLPVLTEDNALILLKHLTPRTVENYPDECRQLVLDLECLPLALHVAGKLLRSEAKLGLSVVDLINGIRQEAKLLPEPGPLDRAEGATIPTVAALLHRSTNHLDELTRDCFAFLGAFAPKPATFDLAAMQGVWEVNDPLSIVRKLVGNGLLEPVGNGRFQMHALLVQHARSLLN